MERRPETISFYRKRLPHWTVAHGLYFVTIRQKDSIPIEAAKAIRKKREELESYSPSDQIRIKRMILVEIEKWLDRYWEEAFLIQSSIPQIIRECIDYRQAAGVWRMIEYVIMPSHVHLFFSIEKGNLKSVMTSFKRWMGHHIKKELGLTRQRVWHREWFDHWSRSSIRDEKIRRYIRNNPVKAGFVKDWRDWPHGSW